MAKANMPLPWTPNWSPDGRWWWSLEDQSVSQGSERLSAGALFGAGSNNDEVNQFFGHDESRGAESFDYCHSNTVAGGDDSFLLH